MINFIFEATVVSSNDIKEIEPEVIFSSNCLPLPAFSFQSTLQSTVQTKLRVCLYDFSKTICRFWTYQFRFWFEKPNYPFCTYRIQIRSRIRKVISWKFLTLSKQNFSGTKLLFQWWECWHWRSLTSTNTNTITGRPKKRHFLNCRTFWETRLAAHYGRIQAASRQWKCLVQKFRKWLFGTSCTMYKFYMNTETKTSWNFPGERLLFHRWEQAGVLRQIYFYQLQARKWLLYSTAAKMKNNYLQNISIALNQSIFFSPKAWMWHSGSGKKSRLYSLASSQGDIISFLLFVRSYKKIITGSSFKDLRPMDSSRFHCFIGRGPFGCIFFLARL